MQGKLQGVVEAAVDHSLEHALGRQTCHGLAGLAFGRGLNPLPFLQLLHCMDLLSK
jgi:hypothetical protein